MPQQLKNEEANVASTLSMPRLTNDQVQRLISLIEATNSRFEKLSGNASWIIDFGALRHMTRNLECLVNRETINPIHVNLSNGESNIANFQGNVSLGPNINLGKVLYIPRFSYNLISVGQLIRELNSIVIFDKNVCVIPGCTSKSLIGVGELRGGVYYVKEFTKSKIQALAMGSRSLWHDRFEHLPNKVLSLFFKHK